MPSFETHLIPRNYVDVRSVDLRFSGDQITHPGYTGEDRHTLRPGLGRWSAILQTIPMPYYSGPRVEWDGFVNALSNDPFKVTKIYDPKKREALSRGLYGSLRTTQVELVANSGGRRPLFDFLTPGITVIAGMPIHIPPAPGHELGYYHEITETFGADKSTPTRRLTLTPGIRVTHPNNAFVDVEQAHCPMYLVSYDLQYSDNVKTFVSYTLNFKEARG